MGKKKWYKKRLTLILTPFTIIMTVGFIVLAVLLGTWVTHGRTTNSDSLVGVGRLPCT